MFALKYYNLFLFEVIIVKLFVPWYLFCVLIQIKVIEIWIFYSCWLCVNYTICLQSGHKNVDEPEENKEGATSVASSSRATKLTSDKDSPCNEHDEAD